MPHSLHSSDTSGSNKSTFEKMLAEIKAGEHPTANAIRKRLQDSQKLEPPQTGQSGTPEEHLQKIIFYKQKAWTAAGWLQRKGLPSPNEIEKEIIKNLRDQRKEFRQPNAQSDDELLRNYQAHQKLRRRALGSISGEIRYCLPEPFWEFVDEFAEKRGLNENFISHIESILRGRIGPKIDCTKIYQQYLAFHSNIENAKKKGKSILKLLRSYRKLNHQIHNDPSFSSSFIAAWEGEYDATQQALEGLKKQNKAKVEGLEKCPAHCTVGLDKPISRQGFWTPVTLVLVKACKRLNLTNNQSFEFIAVLFSKAFPTVGSKKSTFDSDLIKRRYYHAVKTLES